MTHNVDGGADQTTQPIDVATAFAWLVSAVAMIGALGWVSTPVLLRDLGLARSTIVLLTFAVVVGVVAFFSTRALARYLLHPIIEVARLVETAAKAPRDHVRMVKQTLPKYRSSVAVSEVTVLVDAVRKLLGVIDQRNARQTAWTVAVVHDAKAPIAASANALGALAASPRFEGTDEAQLMRQLEAELRHLGSDVQRMIDVARFDRDDIDLRKQNVDLGALVESICDRVRAPESVTLTCGGSAQVIGDAQLLGRALENLVANAVRYARSRVVVEVLPGLVRVADDGGGLADSLDALTSPFRSKSAILAGVAVEGGAGGIGLFLARRVLELHGGRLVVEATGPQGTILLAYIGRGALYG